RRSTRHHSGLLISRYSARLSGRSFGERHGPDYANNHSGNNQCGTHHGPSPITIERLREIAYSCVSTPLCFRTRCISHPHTTRAPPSDTQPPNASPCLTSPSGQHRIADQQRLNGAPALDHRRPLLQRLAPVVCVPTMPAFAISAAASGPYSEVDVRG